MGGRTFLLVLSLILYVLYVTKALNLWGVSKGTKKARSDAAAAKKRIRSARRASWFLSKYLWVERNVGFKLNVTNEKLLFFKINRLHWNVKSLGRDITPLELNGLLKTIQLSGVVLTLFLHFVIGSILSFAFLGLLFAPALLNIYAEYKIAAEDEQLENDFPDLYIVLYTRLLKGSDVRLAPTLKDYLLSFDSMDNGTGKYKNVIRNFVLDFRNNIEIFGDDGVAVLKLRDKYQSAMIINFCNLVTQSLNGVANSDKLLAFKIELNNKRIEQMETKADVLVRRGNRAVMFVYLILAQFVILSWVAKLAVAGGIMSLFGGG